MKRFLILTCFAILACGMLPFPVHAAPTKGLLISPPRTYSSVDAGHEKTNTLTIANTTDNSMQVTLSVQQFSVNDYAYTQTFSAVKQDWLHLAANSVQLAANQSTTIQYSLKPPANVSPGGYYFSIFASTQVQKDGGTDTIQAANLLYVTVNGALTKTSQLKASHIPHFVFGSTIPYQFFVANTGNVHFFIYTQSTLSGLLTKQSSAPQTHILLPGTTRAITDTMQSPLLPGLYHATYGYKTDTGASLTRTQWIVYIPFWFIAAIGVLVITFGRLHVARRPKQNSEKIKK